MNSIWLVEHSNQNIKPNKLIVRFYGGNEYSWGKDILFDTVFGRELEQKVSLAASDMKIGPKVYFASDEYRIEEFIESRPCTFEDYSNMEIQIEFARNLARFHCMIDRKEFEKFKNNEKANLFTHAKSTLTDLKELWIKICTVASEKYNYSGKESDLMDELNLMESISKKLQLKQVLINWDLNPMNILLRKEVTNEDQLKTVLVDYEYAHCNIRAFDIGFVASKFCFINPLDAAEAEYDETYIFSKLKLYEEQFVKSYYEEYTKFCQEKDINGIDTIENITIEAIFGAQFNWIYFTIIHISFLKLIIPKEEKIIEIVAKTLSFVFLFNECTKKRLYQLSPQLIQ